MCQVVANISKYATTEDCGGNRPVPMEDCMCQLPEWSCKDEEQCRRHDQSEFIHWKVVVDAMKQEMEGESNSVVREESEYKVLVTDIALGGRQDLLVEMKQKSMQHVFDQGPQEEAKEPVGGLLENARTACSGNNSPVCNRRQPNHRNHPPRGL